MNADECYDAIEGCDDEYEAVAYIISCRSK
jgi:hypothetical protein